MNTSGQENQRVAPLLCANACGFYGSPTTRNLCSKCYRNALLLEQQQQQERSTNAASSAAAQRSSSSMSDHEKCCLLPSSLDSTASSFTATQSTALSATALSTSTALTIDGPRTREDNTVMMPPHPVVVVSPSHSPEDPILSTSSRIENGDHPLLPSSTIGSNHPKTAPPSSSSSSLNAVVDEDHTMSSSPAFPTVTTLHEPPPPQPQTSKSGSSSSCEEIEPATAGTRESVQVSEIERPTGPAFQKYGDGGNEEMTRLRAGDRQIRTSVVSTTAAAVIASMSPISSLVQHETQVLPSRSSVASSPALSPSRQQKNNGTADATTLQRDEQGSGGVPSTGWMGQQAASSSMSSFSDTAAATIAPSPTSSSSPPPSAAHAPEPTGIAASGHDDKQQSRLIQINKNRCFKCHKKIGLLGFQCRCTYYFCGAHRHADCHDCPFDYKSFGRQQLSKANQRVVAEKLNRI